MTKAKDLFRKWKDDLDFIDEYEALEEEFALASTLIAARTRAAMTQQDVATSMETSQSYIAKLESGTVSPTMKALKRYATATGTKVRITFEPIAYQAKAKSQQDA